MEIALLNSNCTVQKNHCECFDLLSPEQRELLESKQVVAHYKRGEIIAKQGLFATHLMYLDEGLAKVYVEDGEDTLTLKIAAGGSLIGLTALGSENDKFEYTVSSYQESTVKLIDIQIFKKLLLENGAFATKIIQFMGENANQINRRFFCMVNRQSYGKLADLLLCLAGSVFKSNKFELLLSRKELAELAGLSTESVIRLLKDFRKDKLIEIQGKCFEIKDPEGLRRIFQNG